MADAHPRLRRPQIISTTQQPQFPYFQNISLGFIEHPGYPGTPLQSGCWQLLLNQDHYRRLFGYFPAYTLEPLAHTHHIGQTQKVPLVL
jgi:hypothetical protein